jgi:hypothetical protein
VLDLVTAVHEQDLAGHEGVVPADEPGQQGSQRLRAGRAAEREPGRAPQVVVAARLEPWTGHWRQGQAGGDGVHGDARSGPRRSGGRPADPDGQGPLAGAVCQRRVIADRRDGGTLVAVEAGGGRRVGIGDMQQAGGRHDRHSRIVGALEQAAEADEGFDDAEVVHAHDRGRVGSPDRAGEPLADAGTRHKTVHDRCAGKRLADQTPALVGRFQVDGQVRRQAVHPDDGCPRRAQPLGDRLAHAGGRAGHDVGPSRMSGQLVTPR